MDFRSLSYLTSKIQSYSAQTAAAFHGPAPKAFPVKAQYIWEAANTDQYEGFVYYGPRLAAYYNANGEEYILSNYINTAEFAQAWNYNTQLYNRSLSDNRFRIVQPLGFANGFGPRNFSSVTIGSEKYNYYNLVHPDNDLGNLIYFDKDITPDVYAETFIEQFDILSAHLYAILGNSDNYPNVKFNDLVINDGGVYWRFLYKWDLPREGYLAKIEGELEKSIETAVEIGAEPSMYLFDEGRNKWKSTLNI